MLLSRLHSKGVKNAMLLYGALVSPPHVTAFVFICVFYIYLSEDIGIGTS